MADASGSTESDGAAPPNRPGVVRRAAGATRAAIRRNPKADRVYRTTVGVTGVGLTALGVVLIPLPGPGSLVALGGLALLGTEFEGAKKVSTKANDAAAKAVRAARARQAKRRAARAAASSGDAAPAAAAAPAAPAAPAD